MDRSDSQQDASITSATFDRRAIIRYHWSGLVVLSLFIVTIPLAMLLGVIYKLVLDRVVGAWSAELTTQSLIVRKGVWNKVERTIPLEKITDLSVAQGPIMRYCGIDRIGVETAGQTGGQNGAPLINLLGVVDSASFRASVLAQRDELAGRATPTVADDRSATDHLVEISETLRRIEAILERND